MKKNDLIAMLQNIPDNPTIVVSSDNFELQNSLVGAKYVSAFDGKKEVRNFTDGFDGEGYSKEVILFYGNERFIRIT